MTSLRLQEGTFYLNGQPTYAGARYRGESMAGRLFNVRMVNATYEDRNPATCPDGFAPDENTDTFIAAIPEYRRHGVRAFTFNLQGGSPGYEEALNSAFDASGELRPTYMRRIHRVLAACARHGMAAILGFFYQRQSEVLATGAAFEQATDNAARWLQQQEMDHVLVEIANEHDHRGFSDCDIIKSPAGQLHLMERVRRIDPGRLVSTSQCGHGRVTPAIAAAADFLLPHANSLTPQETVEAARALLAHGKPVVFNEDDVVGDEAVRALRGVALAGGSWGYMNSGLNQHHPFAWGLGPAEDAVVYRTMAQITSSDPEGAVSNGGEGR